MGSKSFLVPPRRTSQRWTSSSSWARPCRCNPLPPSSASRLRRTGQGVSWGQGPRADPQPQLPLPRAPLATPRLLINKEKTGQVSLPRLPFPPPPFPPLTLPPSSFHCVLRRTGQVSVLPGGISALDLPVSAGEHGSCAVPWANLTLWASVSFWIPLSK